MNTAFGVPAAAQIVASFSKSSSINVSGATAWPTGGTPPMANPVCSRTKSASARAIFSPITAATFILVYKEPADPAKSAEVLKFFDWAYKNGDKLASDLDYVPLPDNVVGLIHDEWKTIKGKDGKPVFGQ